MIDRDYEAIVLASYYNKLYQDGLVETDDFYKRPAQGIFTPLNIPIRVLPSMQMPQDVYFAIREKVDA